MTIDAWITHSEKLLTAAGIATARLDILVLLADELSEDKSWILAHSDEFLRGETETTLNKKVIQRSHHTPLAYIRGHAEFYGREFKVDHNVLVPRPESESIIALLIQSFATAHHAVIVDIGTGSGCLAVTAKLETKAHEVIATDISKPALVVAKDNARRLNADLTFMQGDLLEPLRPSFADQNKDYIVLANLPYVPTNYTVNDAAKHEPPLALFSGNDGLEHYGRLFKQIDTLLMRPTIIITESLFFQHEPLAEIAGQYGYALQSSDGLAQAFIINQ